MISYGQPGISISGEGISIANLRNTIFPKMDAEERRRHIYCVSSENDGRYYVVPPEGALVDFRWATKPAIIGSDNVQGKRIRIIKKYCGSATKLTEYEYEYIKDD